MRVSGMAVNSSCGCRSWSDTPKEVPRPITDEPVVTTASLRILVVDDNQDAAGMLARLLEFSGHETHTVHDGMGAVEAAMKLQPDVILLDIGLPRLNGYDAARMIREQHTHGAGPVLIALTGWGQEEDRQRSEEAGFHAHLVKPVDEVALGKLLDDLATRKQEVGI